MPKTLLLADDSVVIQKLVGLSFANEDVKLLTTDNGDDAISMARERRPDIVLADVVMPGRSGYEVCQAIKGDPALAHIPVILLTGTFEAFDEARARAAGSDGHITKPFEAQALVERVNSMLREAARKPAAVSAAETDFELFDTDSDDVSLGQDVTRAAPPHLARPLGHAVSVDPLGGDESFDVGQPISSLSELDISDPLDDPFGADDVVPGSIDRPRGRGMMSDMAEDDLLSTSSPSPSSPRVQDSAIGRSFETNRPARALDATPRFEDPDASFMPSSVPPPIPTSAPRSTATARPGPSALQPPALPSAHRIDDFDSDSGARDPSLTTIIMSDGASSSAGVSFGELESPVRSLDMEVDADRDDDVLEMDASATMLADDIFGEPVTGEDSDSGFDFGGASLAASRAPERSVGASRNAAAENPFAVGRSDDRRGAPPEVASRYDVSSSELVDPFEADSDDSSVLGRPDDDLLEATHAEEEIAMSDGLLGEPFDLGGDRHEPPPPAPRSSGPDISPVMRDRIHDTLERVAWEAFADLPDALIKALIERVEAIAWEVIPQMAEALISEEIRRMKGEDQ
jgi:CheY-like chemotaxis protein